jgi:phosphoenolpyruvate-protein kinase (PTS system EI component)
MAQMLADLRLTEKFAEGADGLAIGSHDLTELVLGVNRYSSELSELLDEM